MIDNYLMIGFCCAVMHKEPIKPIIDSLVQRLVPRDNWRMLVYHCFEDLYYETLPNKGAASIYEMINYDTLDVMVLMPCCDGQLELYQKVAEKCRQHNVPVITVDRPIDGAFYISFSYGDAFGQLVEHVITEHDCKSIVHVAGMRNNDFSQTRIDSCRDVMARHGLVLEDKDVLYGEFWDNPTYLAMDEFFASGEPLPDAFICANDSMAMAVIQKLAEHGYSVPDDVIVTGFDGIEIEKYHDPRLTTAVRDIEVLTQTIADLIEKISVDPDIAPYDIVLDYTPVYSESCGCIVRDAVKNNHSLLEYVRDYSYAKGFEEMMNEMGNLISADPTLENAREILRKYSFYGTRICVTDEYYRYFSEDVDAEDLSVAGNNDYPDKMHVLVECENDERPHEGMTFSTSEVIPDMLDFIDGNHALVIVPIHSLDSIIGYYALNYMANGVCKDQMYTYSMMVNQSLETVRTHGRMRFLNNKMEFMFTHDHLTRIYNRYGFYKNFKEDFATLASENKDVFIVSIDLNDMKYINDNFGHHAGDEALRITANALTGAAEKGDSDIICSRFGGDEFVVAKICSGDAKEQAERYRSNFDAVLAGLNAASGNPYTVNVSIGVYCASLSAVDTIDELIELADRLMYNDKARHKRQPRNLK